MLGSWQVMTIPSDFRDLLAEFAAAGVEYLVVGGYAVGVYAEPRFTKDLDVWIGDAPDNLVRAKRALAAFGAPSDVLSRFDEATREDVLWMGAPPLRIDILKGVPGGDFPGAYARRVLVEWGGVPAAIIARERECSKDEAASRCRQTPRWPAATPCAPRSTTTAPGPRTLTCCWPRSCATGPLWRGDLSHSPKRLTDASGTGNSSIWLNESTLTLHPIRCP